MISKEMPSSRAARRTASSCWVQRDLVLGWFMVLGWWRDEVDMFLVDFGCWMGFDGAVMT